MHRTQALTNSQIPCFARLQELFKYIPRYKAKTIELDSVLKPFLPDYLPAIGDLDPFLKVGRPDQERDILGMFWSCTSTHDSRV